MLRPQFVSLEPQHPKGAKTCSSTEFAHPSLGRAALFEFQHAIGDDVNQAFAKGFEYWVQFDLPAVLDALQAKPKDCMVLEMSYPASETRSATLKRRAVLGPPAHLVTHREEAVEAEHPFCPCCLLTNSFEAFKPLLEADAIYGIRLFASRDAQGVAEADCRVNGEDFEPGRAALVKWAEKWPSRGFEFRKQYVILQTVEPNACG
jgi:hypothetical protein